MPEQVCPDCLGSGAGTRREPDGQEISDLCQTCKGNGRVGT